MPKSINYLLSIFLCFIQSVRYRTLCPILRASETIRHAKHRQARYARHASPVYKYLSSDNKQDDISHQCNDAEMHHRLILPITHIKYSPRYSRREKSNSHAPDGKPPEELPQKQPLPIKMLPLKIDYAQHFQMLPYCA